MNPRVMTSVVHDILLVTEVRRKGETENVQMLRSVDTSISFLSVKAVKNRISHLRAAKKKVSSGWVPSKRETSQIQQMQAYFQEQT